MTNMTKYFARILTKRQVKACQRLLEQSAGKALPIDFGTQHFEIKAPDGDVVFAGAKFPSGRYVCRLHREVFNPD